MSKVNGPIQLKRGVGTGDLTDTQKNYRLEAGEPFYHVSKKRLYIGNGVNKISELPYEQVGKGTILIGYNAIDYGRGAVSIGLNAASDDSGVAVGNDCVASMNCVSIGHNCGTTSDGDPWDYVVIGHNNTAVENGVSIGVNSVSLSDSCISIGHGSNAAGANCIAIGTNSIAETSDSISIGNGSNALGPNSVAVGLNAASNYESIAIGLNTNASNSGSIVIGLNAASSSGSIVIGDAANGSSSGSVVIGRTANVSNARSIAIGELAKASGYQSVALGQNARVSDSNTIRLGSSDLSKLTCVVELTRDSDTRDKADISTIPSDKSLKFINSIDPIQYVSNDRSCYPVTESTKTKKKCSYFEYDVDEHKKATNKGKRGRVGVKAQQVYKNLRTIFGSDNYANLVDDDLYDLDKVPSDRESKLTVAYGNFVPLLIGSIKELSKLVSTLQEEVDSLKEGLNRRDSDVGDTQTAE